MQPNEKERLKDLKDDLLAELQLQAGNKLEFHSERFDHVSKISHDGKHALCSYENEEQWIELREFPVEELSEMNDPSNYEQYLDPKKGILK